MILQETTRRFSDVPGPGKCPGAAFVVGLARSLARLVVRGIDAAIIATKPVGLALDCTVARFENSSAADTGNAAIAFHAWRNGVLEPADCAVGTDSRIVEAPCAATAIAFTFKGAIGRITGRYRRAQVVAAGPIEISLCMCRLRAGRHPYQQHAENETECTECAKA